MEDYYLRTDKVNKMKGICIEIREKARKLTVKSTPLWSLDPPYQIYKTKQPRHPNSPPRVYELHQLCCSEHKDQLQIPVGIVKCRTFDSLNGRIQD